MQKVKTPPIYHKYKKARKIIETYQFCNFNFCQFWSYCPRCVQKLRALVWPNAGRQAPSMLIGVYFSSRSSHAAQVVHEFCNMEVHKPSPLELPIVSQSYSDQGSYLATLPFSNKRETFVHTIVVKGSQYGAWLHLVERWHRLDDILLSSKDL